MSKKTPEDSESVGSNKPRRLWKWLKRGLLVMFLLLTVSILLGWAFLPRIAERVIRGMIAEAGLDQTELRVAEVGWRSAVIEDVSINSGTWSVTVKRVKVGYDPSDLANGRMQDIVLEGLVIRGELPDEEGPDAGTGKAVPLPPEGGDELSSLQWVHQLPTTLERIGVIRADGVDFQMSRGGQIIRKSADLQIDQSSYGRTSATVVTDDFKLDAILVNRGDQSEVQAFVTEVVPDRFLNTLEFLLAYDGKFLPEGFALRSAELTGEVKLDGEVMSPMSVTGTLMDVVYDGGDKPVKVQSSPVTMKLEVDFAGPGSIQFAGRLDSVSLPLDPSADFELCQAEGGRADWKAKVLWGGENEGLTGQVKGLRLAGEYDGKPVSLDQMEVGFDLTGPELKVEGSLENGGVKIPAVYEHVLETNEAKEDDWVLQSTIKVGPVVHDQPLPLLNAVSDLFDDMEFSGKSMTIVEFSMGAYQAFQGSVETQISEADISLNEGKVKASGVNGAWKMHIIPLPDDNPGRDDPSFYTLDFSAQKMTIGSKDALDYDLHHQVDQPVVLTGKGRFGMDGVLIDGMVKNLTLHGEKNGSEIDFNSTQVAFSLKGDVLTAEGKTSLGENVIPFSYRHVLESTDDKWDVAGQFGIKGAEIKNPIDNAVMLVEAMEGKTLGGNMSMKVDFSLGSEKDFDGVLTAGIDGGTLTFADDGPVIEGLKGDIRLSSIKTMEMKGFHRVTAKKIKAFDMEMQNMRLDYQLLPSGDIKLKNVAVNALGGLVWLDPFTLPEGNGNYQFKVRAKRLDVAELAKLFPDFNGSISGRIDGLLPMESVGGEIRPRKGGMYLTPRTKGKLRYDAGNKFSAGIDPKTEEYKKMKMVEDSLRNLDLKVLSIRMFDPRDKDKAIVLKLQGQATSIKGSPPIHLNINGFKPDDDTVDFFDLLLRHRDRLNFGL